MITASNLLDPRVLVAIPIYNEARHISAVLDAVRQHDYDIVVIDDGSTDQTPELIAARKREDQRLHVVRHSQNLGYGRAIRSGMRFALENEYDVLVTIDCDGQHQPHLIPDLVAATRTADVVSGSRYLQAFDGNTSAPADRRAINVQMTTVLNRVLGLQLTDSFCGFKAYRVAPLAKLKLTENGYAIPLEFWVRAADHGLTIREFPVPRVYLEEERSFGGALDNSETRKKHYIKVLAKALRNSSSRRRFMATEPGRVMTVQLHRDRPVRGRVDRSDQTTETQSP